jgi:hypothetical protein
LLLFALTPAPYNIIFLFINGLPLGMVWGLVFSFLEGRKITEILGLGLSISFIVSSGFVKTVGKLLMTQIGVSEFWMPFVTGIFFVIPLVVFTFMLSILPPPSQEDIALRTERTTMDSFQRKAFFKRFAPGLIALTIVYLLLTAYRDLRDNFMVDILSDLGYGDQSGVFTKTEVVVGIFVMITLAFLVLFKNNKKAMLANQGIILIGVVLPALGKWALDKGYINPEMFIIFTGAGVYMAYVPFNSILFDRLIATYKQAANAGFLIYLVDSIGYLASAGVYFTKTFYSSSISWLDFFHIGTAVLLYVCPLLIVFSMVYFYRKT